MVTRVRWAAVAMVLVASVTMAADGAKRPRKEAPQRPFMLPGDILRRLRQSPVELRISGIENLQDVARGRLADETWKQMVQPIEYPKVKHLNGLITLEPWPRPKAVEAPMAKAEDAFQKQNYTEAAVWYRRTLEVAPDFYIAHAYLGDTHLFGDVGPRQAITEYDQAIAANPDDYRLYFFRATAHRHLSKTKRCWLICAARSCSSRATPSSSGRSSAREARWVAQSPRSSCPAPS